MHQGLDWWLEVIDYQREKWKLFGDCEEKWEQAWKRWNKEHEVKLLVEAKEDKKKIECCE